MWNHWIIGTMWVTAAVLGAGTAGADSPPNVVCDEPVFDFGTLDNHQVVEHTFTLRNEGDAALHILRAKPSCGCTVADISSKVIQPGEEATLLAKLNLQGRHGPQHKTVTVESNDPDTPRLILAMKGEAVALISVSPQTLINPRLKPGEEALHELTVTSREDKPFEIESIETGNPAVQAEVRSGENAHQKVVAVKTPPDLPRDMVYGQLVIRTNSSQQPTLRVPYRFAVLGEISVYPKEITLLEQSNPVNRILTLAPGMVEDFGIEGVELPVDTMESSVRDLNRSRYRITVKNIVASEELDGKSIRIFTTAQSMQEVEIPFRVIRRN